MKVIICVSCKEEVTVDPIPYGNGYIATCPVCNQLALNEDKKEEKL